MHRRILPLACTVLFLASAVLLTSRSASSTDRQSALVKRGDVVATTSGCKDCHTPGFFYGASDASRELSGSELGWSGPWGTTYPRNLTPDNETGLGKWTDDDIIKAVRTGIRPDHTVLRPPMPWQDYAKLPDDDVKALVAYIRSLPPVKHQAPQALAPGQKPTGSFFVVPPPPAWDAPKTGAGTSHSP